ncbi:MAG: neutral/alkaline non-lysosomal ceramidase N-terminal domain-containing protein [Mariniphaga sp.]|nr:neutral/alkaline non-lysosomal ceramidase N-terminal domain-containing protein [Mariniphaga sp.]
MKPILSNLCILNCFLVLLFSSNANPVSEKNDSIKVGVAKVCITPEVPIQMSGYESRTEPFKGVHDDLFASASVFSDGINKAVLISVDVIGFSNSFYEETVSRINNKTGIKKEAILLSAVHTHGGPVSKSYETNVSPAIEKYVNELQDKIVNVVIEASGKIQPVKIGTGKGICNMNINRRARFADGSIWLGRNPDGICDHEVSVVRIDDLENNPIAVLVNWPCHGTVGGQENYYITGDWPGSTARYIEKELGDNVIVQVTAGASGDINPIYGPNDKFDDIEAIGMLLGEEAVIITEKIKTATSGGINTINKVITAEGKKRLASRQPNQKLEPGTDRNINLSVIKIGDLVFAGISGEVMNEIGLKIKVDSPFENTIVVTHCNGNSGYLCTDEAYPLGGYEVMVTQTMPGTELLITDNLQKMIESVKN